MDIEHTVLEAVSSTSGRQPTNTPRPPLLRAQMRHRHVRWQFRFLCIGLLLCLTALFLYWMFFTKPPFGSEYEFEEQQQMQLQNGNYSMAIGWPSADRPVVLMWTRVFREQNFKLDSDCPFYNRCEFTYDRTALPRASAVVYHIPDVTWVPALNSANFAYDGPEVPNLAPVLDDDGARMNVFFSQENPSVLAQYYKGKDLTKTTFNFFHWTMTYLKSSNFPMPYGGFWVNPEDTKRLGFKPVNLDSDKERILRNKKVRGIVWFVSNCDTPSKREVAVDALNKYIPVAIGGKCAKTKKGRDLCPRSAPTCDHIFEQHYFYIAAENDICEEYVTEKFWSRYHLNSVPIVMRKHIYEGIVPNNSFIAMDQFATPKAMADHLVHLMDSPDEYLQHFAWRAQNWSIAPWNHKGFRIGQCGLCECLLNNSLGQIEPMENAVEWFESTSQCEGGTFAQKWANAN